MILSITQQRILLIIYHKVFFKISDIVIEDKIHFYNVKKTLDKLEELKLVKIDGITYSITVKGLKIIGDWIKCQEIINLN